ncbi:mechanosensitive ion channel family protein [Halalkalicoccus subterraneus]|uniref:mechanosensitive ion channel family protein n=1 Tax=Halalkalicoccus subterraneus TaxID=2675002 RepID=UPI000EFD5454|nr:mechanosensitive ion channel family protein [Halalkalicoccus subterraneus]
MEIGPTIAETVEGFFQWLVTSLTGQLLIAGSILAIGWYVSGIAVRLLGRPVAQRFERESLSRTVLRTIKLGIILFSAVVAAGVLPLGIGLSDILLSVTVLSAVIGVILAPVIGNYVGGLFVLADQPYEIGDMVEIVDAQQRGFIEDITLRYTKLLTEDNSVLVIPNNTIRERDVINYTAEDERTRMTIDMSVTYEGDLAEARRLAVRAARQTDGVIAGGPTIRVGNARYPARPTCQIREYGDHGVAVSLRYWVRTPYYTGKVQSEIQERIWEELKDADVEIPYPHTHVVFDETSGEMDVAVNRTDDTDPDVSRRP